MLFAALADVERYWPLTAAAAATTFLMFRLQARRRRQLLADRATATSFPPGPQQPPKAVKRWEAELFDYCREVEARLDGKIAALQQLVLSADERIAHLESLGLDTPPPAEPSAPATMQGPHFVDVQSRHAAIYAMADAGRQAAMIANRLAMPIGDVEAILNLRRSANS